MKTLLIVEDEKVNAELIYSFFCDRFHVKIAYNGKDGYDAYKKFKPSIIISDISMPYMHGIEMAQKIREHDLNTKIIFLTAHNEVDMLLQSSSLKLTQYILKPLDLRLLDISIKKALQELDKFTMIKNESIELCKHCKWDFKNLTLMCGKEDVSLTPNEKKILDFLLHHPNELKRYEEIIDIVSDEYNTLSKKSLLTHLNTLRKKLPENIIENVYGIGYRIKID